MMANLSAAVILIFCYFIHPSPGENVTAQNGVDVTLQCNFPSKDSIIRWQVIEGNNTVNIGTCNNTDNTCKFERLIYTGSVTNNNMTATLTVMANVYETKFQCLDGNNQSLKNYSLELNGDNIIAERYKTITLECNFTSSASTITWQLLNGTTNVDIGTCNNINNTCALASRYSGKVTNKNMTATLIFSPATYTQFICLDDKKKPIRTIHLELYTWPSNVYCKDVVLGTNVELTCTMTNVYPAAIFSVYLEYSITRDSSISSRTFPTDPRADNKECNSPNIVSQITLPYPACKFSYPLLKLTNTTNILFYIMPRVSDKKFFTQALKEEFVANYTMPFVSIPSEKCPSGKYTKDGKTWIKSEATCTCEVSDKRLAQARWFKKDNTTVGDINYTNKSSILTFTFNSTDPDQKYICRPITTWQGNVTSLTYKPEFMTDKPSSASHTAGTISVLLQSVFVLGAIYQWTTYY